MDAICVMAKMPGLPDVTDPYDLRYLGGQPHLHHYLQEMNERVLRPYGAFAVGEAAFVGPDEGLLFLDPLRQELNTVFHFQVCDEMGGWNLPRFRAIQNAWASTLGEHGVVGQFLNNHDHTRQVTRFGNDGVYRVRSAKLLAMMIHALPGIPCIYQGEEIGMTGLKFDRIESYRDILSHHMYHQLIEQGQMPNEAMAYVHLRSRDNSRTPMQWNSSIHAGFTSGEPWLLVNPNYLSINVSADEQSPDSIQLFYRNLIRLRHAFPAMIYGVYQDRSNDHPDVYVFTRQLESERLLILLNPSDQEQIYVFPDDLVNSGVSILLSNSEHLLVCTSLPGIFTLAPHLAILFRML
jgi:oligo-1,6-glucosidase